MFEPQHIDEILPAVMADIAGRRGQHCKQGRRERVISAVADFLSNKQPERQDAGKEAKFHVSQGKLFET